MKITFFLQKMLPFEEEKIVTEGGGGGEVVKTWYYFNYVFLNTKT